MTKDERIVAAYKDGLKTNDISEAFSITPTGLYRILRRHGVIINRAGRRDITLEAAIAGYERYKNIALVAQELGCSSATTWKRLKEGGVDTTRKPRTGPSHHWWRGGTSSKWDDMRSSPEYKTWKTAVHLRDKSVCQLCRHQTLAPQAHHIAPKWLAPDLVSTISNGITLCPECHNKIVNGRELMFCDWFKDAVDLGEPLPEGIYRWFAEVLLDKKPAYCKCGCRRLTRMTRAGPNRFVNGHGRRGRKMTTKQREAVSKFLFKPMDPAVADKIKDLRRFGKTHRQIASELNVSSGYVQKVLAMGR